MAGENVKDDGFEAKNNCVTMESARQYGHCQIKRGMVGGPQI